MAPAKASVRHVPLSDARLAAIGAELDRVRARCDVSARRRADPVEFAHRYATTVDRELVALLSACLAFGNVKALTAKIDDALGRLGPSPSRTCEQREPVERALAGWKHRLYVGADVACLLVGACAVQREHGSLGAAFASDLATSASFEAALSSWVDRIRARGGLDRRESRGALHLLPRPDGGSANKRLMLFLRWMVRPADGVDLGLWAVPASRLVVPLDVHIHKLARNLGFTTRPSATWKAALEVTRELARLDLEDPVKYDFSLCHLGMLQRCPSRRDPVRCEGCGVQPVCRHWQPTSRRARERGTVENCASKAARATVSIARAKREGT
jgi:uncharacterized protein (TIGR02757 family)